MSEQHRPLITRHGTHCICGVFCASGRDVEAWRSHVEDRTILDGMVFGVNSSPIGEGWWNLMRSFGRIAEAQARVVQRLGETLKGVGLR